MLTSGTARAATVHFQVVYGVSGQAVAPYDLTHTRQLLDWRPRELPA